jgi:RNA polymerase sigma-70 factor, ECF subfamily
VYSYVTIAQSVGHEVSQSGFMNFSEEEYENLRTRLRFKVCYDLGFACPDVDDVIQETLARFVVAARDGKILNPAAVGAFLNGICRNVISEYRRRTLREDPMPENLREPESSGIQEADHLELRQAIAHGLAQLAERDRQLLQSFYLEEKSKEEILRDSGMSDQNFRVVLCRAKERFRAIYLEQTKHSRAWRHSGI